MSSTSPSKSLPRRKSKPDFRHITGKIIFRPYEKTKKISIKLVKDVNYDLNYSIILGLGESNSLALLHLRDFNIKTAVVQKIGSKAPQWEKEGL